MTIWVGIRLCVAQGEVCGWKGVSNVAAWAPTPAAPPHRRCLQREQNTKYKKALDRVRIVHTNQPLGGEARGGGAAAGSAVVVVVLGPPTQTEGTAGSACRCRICIASHTHLHSSLLLRKTST